MTAAPYLSPDQIGELTFPQLVILMNDGELPNPRRRTFASPAQAEAYALTTAQEKPNGAQHQAG